MKRILILTLLHFYIYGEELDTNNLIRKEFTSSEVGYEMVIETPVAGLIEITSNTPLTEEQETIIAQTYKTFYLWDEIEIESSEMVFEGSKLSIIIKPKSLIYNEVDISPYLPSGIQLYYETFYEFDFRMFKDLLFMRLKGQFYSKDEFLGELFNAQEDPILYVQIHDPSYLIRQIDKLRNENNDQSKLLYQQREDFNTLLNRHKELLIKHNMLVESVISLNNRSFFGSLKEFDSNHIAKVVELKENSPELTVKEVISRLKQTEIKVTPKLVESVFMVYFGEFPQNDK